MSIEAMKLALDVFKSATPKYTRQRKDQKTLGGALDYWRLEQYQRMKAIKALEEALAKQEQGEPVAFKIYKPTPPRHAIPNVRDAELPWVYDQDPSSGNVASMWVTPVQTLRSKT